MGHRVERLKNAVKHAAKLREDSWDAKAEKYAKSLQTAADEAAEAFGFDTQATTPIYLLLRNAWNDTLAWTEGVDVDTGGPAHYVERTKLLGQLTKIKSLNDNIQGVAEHASAEWHAHETIDDVVHDLLTELGD